MKTAWLAALAAVTMVAPATTGAALAQRGDYRWQGDRDGRWEPADHYRDGRYRERRLSSRDRVYRGENGQYYCRRNDGTTGLIVGGLAGGVLGNVIAPGGSGLLGTLLGGAAGAAVGRSVDRNNVRCR